MNCDVCAHRGRPCSKILNIQKASVTLTWRTDGRQSRSSIGDIKTFDMFRQILNDKLLHLQPVTHPTETWLSPTSSLYRREPGAKISHIHIRRTKHTQTAQNSSRLPCTWHTSIYTDDILARGAPMLRSARAPLAPFGWWWWLICGLAVSPLADEDQEMNPKPKPDGLSHAPSVHERWLFRFRENYSFKKSAGWEVR